VDIDRQPPRSPTRRSFLRRLGEVGGAAAVYQGLHALGLVTPVPAYAGPPQIARASGKEGRVVVLGAGVTGLVAAHELRKHGFQVTVLEARGRPGGRVFTVRSGDSIDETDSHQRVLWDRDPELFFDAGAARLPQHHQGILGYARELSVPLEVLSNQNRQAWLQRAGAFGGVAQRSGHVNADARGYVAELAHKAVDQAAFAQPLGPEDKEKLRAFLREYGALDKDGAYKGSTRAGYKDLPGGGAAAGSARDPLALRELLRAEVWAQVFAGEESPVQVPTMLRPVGGMQRIPAALAKTLGSALRSNAEVQRVRRTERGARVDYKDTRTGKLASLDADAVLVTIQPGLLTQLDHDFSPSVREALAAPVGTPLAKVAFQATRRFWELDDQIYGGISWTDHPITQIWYPSNGIHGSRGVLVGAYVFFHGEEFAKATPEQRLELALEGGELLHPGRYRSHLEKGVSISWKKARYAAGATTRWSDEARAKHYPVLLEPDGPYHFAGEYLSYVNGWQEGAVRSAHHALPKLVQQITAQAVKKVDKV
jgi:monoamine oxidase